jgi:hypothetical protein
VGAAVCCWPRTLDRTYYFVESAIVREMRAVSMLPFSPRLRRNSYESLSNGCRVRFIQSALYFLSERCGCVRLPDKIGYLLSLEHVIASASL